MAAKRKPRITLVCQTCRQPFEVVPFRAKNRRFCSKACNLKCGRLKPLIEKKCEGCGQPFYVPLYAAFRRFCRSGCRYLGGRAPLRGCAHCSKQFTPKLNRQTQIHCTRRCYLAAKARQPRACPQCSLQFTPATARQKTCSVDCQGLARRSRITKLCGHCGSTFEVGYSLRSRRQHCSKECQLKEQFRSKSEERVVAKVGRILKDVPERHAKFAWLKSDAKRAMYVDAVFPAQKIAVEYDGPHHYQFVPCYHHTPKGFANSQRRDALKEQLLKEHGYAFIRIRFDEPYTVRHLKERVALAIHERTIAIDDTCRVPNVGERADWLPALRRRA
jgi:hypothetical protein